MEHNGADHVPDWKSKKEIMHFDVLHTYDYKDDIETAKCEKTEEVTIRMRKEKEEKKMNQNSESESKKDSDPNPEDPERSPEVHPPSYGFSDSNLSMICSWAS